MFKKFIDAILGKAAPADASAQPAQPAATEPLPQFRVSPLAGSDDANPFVVDGYDCLSFVRAMKANASDPAVARSFAEFRKVTGSSYAGQFPPDAMEIASTLEYPGEQVRDGMLYKAGQMEQKWDIYLYREHLYFCRSWTGALVYVAAFAMTKGKIAVDKIWAAREALADDPAFAVREVDYLIKSHVMQARVPHPLPPELPPDAETIGQYSFSQYGNMCCFGTYADTLPANLVKPERIKAALEQSKANPPRQ
ncbi:hypothetical protein ACO0LO_04960 [Undibacterium sp. TJN25]|uniref:hypothetical protein n=1 Tax=Undibacterium sp. TJN25 TaxID=3413056 RepID=UPI003BF3617B